MLTRTPRFLGTLLVALLALEPARAADPDKVLASELKAGRLTLRARPGSRAAASFERTSAMAERDLDRIAAVLDSPIPTDLVLYLYDDVPELAAITGVPGNAGFSAVNKVHIPFDNDQTRMHELVHVVAYRLPKTGDEPRHLFFAEGLANAVLEYVDGVHVHAVAAFARRTRALPRLVEMTQAPNFYAWMRAHPTVPAYDIAASYVRFLIDVHGIARVKRYYTGTTAAAAFDGASEDRLEAAWHAALDAYVLRPEVETLLRRRAGEPAKHTVYELDPDKRLPPDLLGAPDAWKLLGGERLAADVLDEWRSVDGTVIGAHTKDASWSAATLGATPLGDAVVRARVRPSPGCVGVQLRLGPGCQGMVTVGGAFLGRDQAIVAAERAEPLGARRELDLVLVRRGSRASLWVDGFKVCEGEVGAEPALPGVAVAGGEAQFVALRSRR